MPGEHFFRSINQKLVIFLVKMTIFNHDIITGLRQNDLELQELCLEVVELRLMVEPKSRVGQTG